MLGVMGEKEDLIMDYIKEEDLPEKGNNGYNLRLSERSGNQLRCLELILATFPTIISFLHRKEEKVEMTVTIQHFTWDEVRVSPI